MATTYRNEFDVVDALGLRFVPPEWAFLRQVGDGTGWNKVRTADALAMNLWPSRGLELWGFEVKCHRNDLLNELKNPAKAESIARYCDKWWIVLGDKKILKPLDPLPEPWGVMVPRGRQFVIQKQAAPLPDPKPLGRSFVAAVMRQAYKQALPDQTLFDTYDAGYRAGIQKRDKQRAATEAQLVKYDKKAHDRLQAELDAFEAASGVSIKQWPRGQKIGHAVRFVLDGRLPAELAALAKLAREVGALHGAMESVLRQCKEEEHHARS